MFFFVADISNNINPLVSSTQRDYDRNRKNYDVTKEIGVTTKLIDDAVCIVCVYIFDNNIK